MRVFCFIISEDFVIGHYTQFVWAETTKVGCGILISKVGPTALQSNNNVCQYDVSKRSTSSTTWSVTITPRATTWELRSTSEASPALPVPQEQNARTDSVPE